MAQKRRSSKRKAPPKKKRFDAQNNKPLELDRAMREALAGIAKPARAVLDRIDAFKREHPKLYEIITRDVDSADYRRRVERRIERVQARTRGSEQ